MLRHIIAVYTCDSCHEEGKWVLGNFFSGAWRDLGAIWDEIKFGLLPGWIRDEQWGDGPKHWCPKCHMKKEIKELK